METYEIYRDSGVICYRTNLFGMRTDLDRNIDNFKPARDMLSTDLWWYWESYRLIPGLKGPVTGKLDLPDERPLTMLTPDNVELLIAEWCEQCEIDAGRYFSIIGLDKGVILPQDNAEALKEMIRDFSFNENGPIHIVIINSGESSDEDIYVPHEPIDQVRNLLSLWGLPKNVSKRLKMRGEPYLNYAFGFAVPRKSLFKRIIKYFSDREKLGTAPYD